MTDSRQRSAARTDVRRNLALIGLAVRDRVVIALMGALLLAVLGALTGALWPPLRDTFRNLPASVSDVLAKILSGADLSTPSGWVNAEMISLVASVVATAVAVVSVVRGVAGEEQTKTLDVLLSAPVSRSAFLLAKVGAMLVHVLVVDLGLALGLVLAHLAGDLGLATSGTVGACLHALLLGVMFGTLAALVCAVVGDRRLGYAVVGGLAWLSFAINAFLPLSDSLAGLARVSPWYYFAAPIPLVNGPDFGDLLVLLALAVLWLVLAVAAFGRRDLRG